MSDSVWESLVRTRKAIGEFEANRSNVNEFNHDGTWLIPVSVYRIPNGLWFFPAGYELPMPVPDNYPCTMQYVPIFHVDAYRRIRFT